MPVSDIHIDQLSIPLFEGEDRLSLLRCDLFEPEVPGNKYWKLKYNVQEMFERRQDHLVTFGGAFSNHIAAVAAAGKKFNFKTTGIIRGEANSASNHTLFKAQQDGMKLKFIDRSNYREWKKGKVNLDEFLGFSDYYLLPEGGTNVLAVKGCREILQGLDQFDLICCAVGSGGTIAGLISASHKDQHIMGFSSLKNGQYMEEEITSILSDFQNKFPQYEIPKGTWTLNHDHHFGGFAKVTDELIQFYREFQNQSGIELDLIYTAKMLYAIRDLWQRGKLNDFRKILIVHSGGQQGNASLLKRRSIRV